MSRSYHVTNKQLRLERIENSVNGVLPSSDTTELEVADTKKEITKTNVAWAKQAKRDKLKPGLRIRVHSKKIEVI